MPVLDKTKQYTGRKARVGRTHLVQAEGKNIVGVFVAYCPDCEYKILLTHQEMLLLMKRYRESSKSLRERCIRYLLKKLEMPEAEYEYDRDRERHAEYVMTQY